MKTSPKKEDNVMSPTKKKGNLVVATKVSKPISKAKKSIKDSKKAISTSIPKEPSKKNAKPRVSKTKQPKEQVYIPSGASLRLLEKIEIYKLWYQDNLSRYMVNTAKVGGYTFIILGALFASLSLIIDKNQLNFAAVICTDSLCTDIDNEYLPPGLPNVTFINSLPSKLKNDTDIVIKIENSENFRVYLKSVNSREEIDVSPIENLPNDEYRFLIPSSELNQGIYVLSAEIKNFNKTYRFDGPTFSFEPEVSEELSISEVDSLIEETEEVATSSDIQTSEIENITVEDELVATTSNYEVVAETTVEENLIKTQPVDYKQLSSISLTLQEIQNSEYIKIDTNDIIPDRIEIYARTIDSSYQLLYLGLATLVQGEWMFNLSALSLPAVDMLLVANLVTNESTLQTEGIFYRNQSLSESSSRNDLDASILNQKIILSLNNSGFDLNSRLNYFDFFTSSSTSEQSDLIKENEFADDSISVLATELMNGNNTEINKVLLSYASAVTVGQSSIIKLAEEQIIEQYKYLAKQASVELENPESMPIIETVLALRYQRLKESISVQETEINKMTSSLISKDTDGDGFSDFDELTIYFTDPNSADTDNDSVLDSVEIISNFSPLDADVKSFVNINKSNSTNQDEILKINSVEPLVVKQLNGTEFVYAIIHGTAIPNSYVSVISYSEPTVGIIKTNNQGSFTYTNERALEEGVHNVKIALGDNNGNAPVTSKNFTFTKKSNDITASAISTTQSFFEPATDRPLLPSTIIASIAVVAFGFVLLLLAQTIRNSRKVLVKA